MNGHRGKLCRCVVVGWVIALAACAAVGQTRTSEHDAALKRYLDAHPEADTDGDGILTDFEHAGHLPRAMLERFAAEGNHEHVDVAMRDGVKLATEVFRPKGDGPWPVVLMRTPYGRWNTGGYARRFAGSDVAFVVQDLRGSGDSQGKGTYTPTDFTIEINDSRDTVAWIAKQNWCNGRVGMTGGSGHGMAAAMAYWSQADHLVAVMPGNTAGHQQYWLTHNGVRRWTYRWLGVRGGDTGSWPRPHPEPGVRGGDTWADRIAELAKGNPIVYANSTGWFDTFSQGALDDFAAIAKTGGKAFVVVEPRGHGGIAGLKYPSRPRPQAGPSLTQVLSDPRALPDRPRLVYYLMGDVRDPEAPGNRWLVTDTWPIPHTLRKYHLVKERLSLEPAVHAGRREYTYDPRNPAPSLGGHYTYAGEKSGPHDQRSLLEREDVLKFQTEPLAEPLTVVGRLSADLYVESDAPDTLFVVKVVDVYPDGYHAIVRESAGMARFGDDLTTQSRLEPGEIRKLTIDLWSTAYVFAKGHRLALIVTSSSDPAYEVHPNTYDPVEGVGDTKAATNRIHWSMKHRSAIMLPIPNQSLID